MKFLIYLIIWEVCSEIAEFKSIFTNGKRKKVMENFLKNSSWNKHILSEKIIIDNELKTIDKDKLFESVSALSIDKNDFEEIYTFNETMLQVSKTVYTALQCKYSDLIIRAYIIFFDCANTCDKLSTHKRKQCVASIIKTAYTLKDYIVKMIIDLMQFKKIHPNLGSSDPTLLKSLISINLFLNQHAHKYVKEYESNKDSEKESYDINIKIVLSKIINLIERFSCKHCYIQDAYNFNKRLKENIKDLDSKNEDIYERIQVLLKITEENKLYTFSKLLPIDNESIIKNLDKKILYNIYDPNYLILEDIFSIKNKYSFFPFLEVKWQDSNDWDELQNVYNKVKNTDDIKIIFDYQILIIEVIKYIFYVKFINIHLTNYQDTNNNQVELLYEFDKFIDKIIPNNYPTNLYSPIITLRNLLYIDVHILTDKKTFTNDTLILLVKNPVIKTWDESIKINESINEIVMSEFLKDILELKFFDHFIQIFELLSYESNTLGDYYLFRGNSDEKNKNSRNAKIHNKSIEKLRYNFVRFQVWLDINLKTNDLKNSTKTIKPTDLSLIEIINSHTFWYFKKFLFNDQLNKIFLPLIINFSKLNNNNVNTNIFFILRQNMVLALNLLEYYELQNCILLKFNRVILREVKGTEKYDSQLSVFKPDYKKRIETAIHEETKNYQIDENQKVVYSTSVEEYIKKLSNICNTNSTIDNGKTMNSIIWDGSKKSIYEVCTNIYKSANAVVDYQQLVRFQVFEIKWIITNVFEQLFFIVLKNDVSIDEKNNQNEYGNVIKNEISLFGNLQYPESISSYIQSYIHQYLIALKYPDTQTKRLYKDRIHQQLKILSMSIEEYSEEYYENKINGYEIKKLIDMLKKTIIKIKNILKVINDNNLIEKLQFSTIFF